MNEQPISVELVARKLADALEDRGIPYAIGGALAYNPWAVPRGTKDVDLNIWIDPTQPTAATHLLGQLGCQS